MGYKLIWLAFRHYEVTKSIEKLFREVFQEQRYRGIW